MKDHIYNSKGAIVYLDINRQPKLHIPEGSIVKKVLSVGVHQELKPVVTIQEPGGPVCYILPDGYIGWCSACVQMAHAGTNVFPSEVVFSKLNGQYFADIL